MDFLISKDEVEVQTTLRKSRRSTKYTIYPISSRAQRRGHAPRNVEVEIWGDDVGKPGKVFVRWIGWNYWCWVYLKNDPNYKVMSGWKGSTKVIAAPYHRTF